MCSSLDLLELEGWSVWLLRVQIHSTLKSDDALIVLQHLLRLTISKSISCTTLGSDNAFVAGVDLPCTYILGTFQVIPGAKLNSTVSTESGITGNSDWSSGVSSQKIIPSKTPSSAGCRSNRMDQVATVRIVMIFAITVYFGRVVSPQAVANFTVDGDSYDCKSNMICLGQAHASEGDEGSSKIQPGRLALLNTSYSSGIAYYKQPVKLLDLSTNQLASFSTSFTFDVTPGLFALARDPDGDGMAFIITPNNSYVGGSGVATLGIFNNASYSTPFKSIVVEFDTYDNYESPIFDISDNHVSFDFVNITTNAAANASDVDLDLGDEETKYVWVDYNRDTLLLEVRVNYNTSRPISALLNYTVNLSDFVEEQMWVGFSSSSGFVYNSFYIGNWTFESSGIPAPSPAPAPTPSLSILAPNPVPAPTPSLSILASNGGHRSGRNKLRIILGISVGIVAFLLVGAIVIALVVVRRSSGGRNQFWIGGRFTEDPLMQIDGMPDRFSYKQLSVATKGFSEHAKLGQGGFGSVYRGVLPSSGISVAVKKINSDSNQGEKEFTAEVSIISRLRHRNLIQLQGWCNDASRDKYLLVYELMPNGSLDKVLFQAPENQTVGLSWEQRFNIVTGTAAAVDYLHQGWKQQVIHRDIKSSNIMLDEEWNAKLGDFGLARLVDHKREAATTVVAGTYGYIAPEAASSGRFTDKTDVFAFGAVVLEIACGRSAFSIDCPPEEMFLVDWVWQSLSESALLSTVDKRLVDYDPHQMEVVLIVGLLCSHPNPLARPSMRQVVQVLAGDAPVPPIPASKPAAFSDQPKVTIDYLHHGPKSGSSSNSRSGTISLVSLGNSDSSGGSTVKSFGSSHRNSSL